ncbi:MAG TPA: universal stress protein [Flavobacteriales bacterium]
MKTLVVATDMSPAANNAALYAAKAAQITRHHLVLFHLYKVPHHVSNSLIGTKGIDEMVEFTRRKLEHYAKELADMYQVTIDVDVRMGEMMEVIPQVMEQYDAEMLVMGMPKLTFEQALLGNTTRAAMQRFQFPIFIIPEGAGFQGIKRILYACDLSKGVDKRILHQVKHYARLFNAELQVIYVGDPERSIKEEQTLKREMEDLPYTYKNVQSESVTRALQEEALNIHADVIIMTPHKSGFWASVLGQSKTKAMLSQGTIPLLSIA